MGKSAVVIECLVEAGGWPAVGELQALADAAIGAAVSELQLTSARCELSLVFTDDAHIEELNSAWRGRQKPTNVLSFPIAAISPGELPGPLLGDIVVALETVKREARVESKPFNNHLTHLMIHGFLHLLGYDHQTESEGMQMEALERRILDALSVPDPYGGPRG